MKHLNYLSLNSLTNIKELKIRYNKNLPIALRDKQEDEFALISLKRGIITNIYPANKRLVQASSCANGYNGYKSIICKIVEDCGHYFLERVDGRTFK